MKCAVVLTLSLLLGFLPAAADDLKGTAEIPFPFIVAGKTLPAGEYEIYKPTSLSRYALWLREIRTHQAVICLVNMEDTGIHKESKLVFNRYNDQTFLRTVVLDGEASTLLKSKAEKTLIAAGAGRATETVMAYHK